MIIYVFKYNAHIHTYVEPSAHAYYTALCNILYKRLRNTLTYLLTTQQADRVQGRK